LPKRVIRLDFTNKEDIKLIECDGDNIGKYVALSHCWGDATHMEKVMTEKENYTKRLDGIEYSVLPRSFQDAALLCWALGIEYLWIDSICIIQDDPQDWQNESAKMTAIYEDAFITIAATAASGCREGLNFNYPRPWHFPQFSVGRAGDLKGLRQQPLYKRGWTLQEMELSPRLIHFAADQLYFVCRSRMESAYGQHLGPGRALSHLGPARGDAERDLWWDWVEDYSRRTLTRRTDKLPAFAGLTRKFQQLTSARPAVGLWMEDIHYGLLWRPTAPRDIGPRDTKPGEEPKIPSWSWASFEGAI
ncbi:Heterokaryon incompatibility protein (HET) domain containing protein, partial [Rhypophila decipiens]